MTTTPSELTTMTTTRLTELIFDTMVGEREEKCVRLRELETAYDSVFPAAAQRPTQRRLLPFLLLDLEDRYRTLTQVPDSVWGPRTKAAYWATISAMAPLLGLTKTPSHHQRILTAEAKKTTTWNPEDPTQFISAMDIDIIRNTVGIPAKTRRIIDIAFSLGQRVGDTLRWRTDQVALQHFPQMKTPVLSVTIVEGKTVEHSGPYTLFIPFGGALSDTILEQIAEMKAIKPQSKYVFLESQVLLSKKDTEKAVLEQEAWMHADLKGSNLDLDLRAIRRGGLSLMAQNAIPMSTILLFSRHQSVKTLSIYLHRDAFNADHAKQMTDTILCCDTRTNEEASKHSYETL